MGQRILYSLTPSVSLETPKTSSSEQFLCQELTVIVVCDAMMQLEISSFSERPFLPDNSVGPKAITSLCPMIITELRDMTVVKIIELIGSSQTNWEEAVKNAIAEAAKTVDNIKSVYVKSCKAVVEENKIVEYRANVKIAFVVNRKK